MLSEISQTKKTSYSGFHFYVESKKIKLLQNRPVIAGGRGQGWAKWGKDMKSYNLPVISPE